MSMFNGWERLADQIAFMEKMRQRLAAIDAELLFLRGLGGSQRVSANGNIVDERGSLVARVGGINRRWRKLHARRWLEGRLNQTIALDAEREGLQRELALLEPAQPGRLFGVLDVPDLRRVTAAQAQEAINLATEQAGGYAGQALEWSP